MQKAIIVHNLEHCILALEAVGKAKQKVYLQSAPGAIAYAGAEYLKSMMDAAAEAVPGIDYIFIVDCSDYAGLALGALRSGIKAIRLAPDMPSLPALTAIAEQMGARVFTEPFETLDLHENTIGTEKALEKFLNALHDVPKQTTA